MSIEFVSVRINSIWFNLRYCFIFSLSLSFQINIISITNISSWNLFWSDFIFFHEFFFIVFLFCSLVVFLINCVWYCWWILHGNSDCIWTSYTINAPLAMIKWCVCVVCVFWTFFVFILCFASFCLLVFVDIVLNKSNQTFILYFWKRKCGEWAVKFLPKAAIKRVKVLHARVHTHTVICSVLFSTRSSHSTLGCLLWFQHLFAQMNEEIIKLEWDAGIWCEINPKRNEKKCEKFSLLRMLLCSLPH